MIHLVLFYLKIINNDIYEFYKIKISFFLYN